MERIRNSALYRRYRTDGVFRAKAALYRSLLINLAFVAVKVIGGYLTDSLWLYVLAGYYLLLSAMRCLLSVRVPHRPAGEALMLEWRRYRLCGIALLGMNQALAVVVFLIVRRGNGFIYPGVLVYAVALYAFYAVIMAAVNMVRYKRYRSPVLSAAKVVDLVAAMVSMLALETALLTQFGEPEQEQFSKIMVSITGIAICAGVLALAIEMIRRANRAIRHLKKEEHFT